ncbi:MAG: hypothetical protein GXY83_38720 [Rhodopirellula sp.]|nr:hypothetical protein [Rhodopirellula sp.]
MLEPSIILIFAVATAAGTLLAISLGTTLMIWGVRLWKCPTMNQVEPLRSRTRGRLVSMAVSVCAAADLVFVAMAVGHCCLSLAAAM